MKINKTRLIIIIILLLGLGASIYLVQNKAILKSRAGSDISNSFNITDSTGQPLEYQGNNTFKTSTPNIKIGIKNLQGLTK